MSEQVAEYRGLCETLAARIVRPGRMSRNGVEHDDLVQEGWIAVWHTLYRGAAPNAAVLRGVMLMYVRKMGAAKRGGSTEFVPYEEEYHDENAGG